MFLVTCLMMHKSYPLDDAQVIPCVLQDSSANFRRATADLTEERAKLAAYQEELQVLKRLRYADWCTVQSSTVQTYQSESSLLNGMQKYCQCHAVLDPSSRVKRI